MFIQRVSSLITLCITTAIIFATAGTVPLVAVIFPRFLVFVWHALAVVGVVFPIAVSVVGIHPVVTDIDIVISVNVDIDPATSAAPMTSTPKGVANANTNSKPDTAPDGGAESIARWVVIPWRVARPPPGSVYISRVVGWYVDNLRLGRLNDNNGFGFGSGWLLDGDRLLFGGFQIALVIGFITQFLNRVHHGFRIRQESITHVLNPVSLFAHHRQYLRERDQ